MDNKERFIKSLHVIACLNCILSSLEESLGVIVDDKAFNGALYKAYDDPCAIAIDCLKFNNVSDENTVYNRILDVTLDNYEDFAEEVWDEYGNT